MFSQPQKKESGSMKILVTGATSGIGRQLALDYHREGHEVWALGRNPERLAELARLGLETGAVDLMDREATLNWFSRLAVIDLAILSAGSCEYIDLPGFDSALLGRMMRVNVETMGHSNEALLPLLRRAQGGGQIPGVGRLAPCPDRL